MPKLRLHFIRHGQSVANTQHLFGLTPDSPLSSLGEAQARLLGSVHGPALRRALLDGTIFASPIKRAMQTATIALEEAEVQNSESQYLVRDSLKEIYRGDWDGKKNEGDLKKQFEELEARDPIGGRPPGAGSESRQDVQKRAATFLSDATGYLQEMSKDGQDVDAYVFCHQVVIECLFCHVLGVGLEHRVLPENTSVSTIEHAGCEGGTWTVKGVNNVRHLQVDPLVAIGDLNIKESTSKRQKTA